jgi:hypothetical protein
MYCVCATRVCVIHDCFVEEYVIIYRQISLLYN